MRRLVASGLVAAALATAGCFPLGINAHEVDQPVSLSQSIGQKVRFARHFRYEFLTWYAAGMIPLLSMPGHVAPLTPADRMVGRVLKDELRKGGDGIVNLRVTQHYNWWCLLLHYVPTVVLMAPIQGPNNTRITMPLAPVYWGLFPPMAAVIEGDVVSLVQGAGRPKAMVALAGDRLDPGRVPLRRLVADALRPPFAPAPTALPAPR